MSSKSDRRMITAPSQRVVAGELSEGFPFLSLGTHLPGAWPSPSGTTLG